MSSSKHESQPEVAIAASDLLAQQSALLADAARAIPHRFDACTYTLGYIRQPVHLCLTCTPVPENKTYKEHVEEQAKMKERAGVCAACSVACHGEHEQVELFSKRAFRCDCPTARMGRACTLLKLPSGEGGEVSKVSSGGGSGGMDDRAGKGKGRRQEEESDEGIKNTENKYGQNFWDRFCRCGRPYDPEREKEAMIQCLSCEDWFHESCLNLRERVPLRGDTPTPVDPPSLLATSTQPLGSTSKSTSGSTLPSTSTSVSAPTPIPPALDPIAAAILGPAIVASRASSIAPAGSSSQAADRSGVEEDGDDDEDSDDGLPRALLTDREYDSLICGACVGQAGKNGLKEVLEPYVGGEGVLVVARKRRRRVPKGRGESSARGEEWSEWSEWEVLGTPVEEEDEEEEEDEDEGGKRQGSTSSGMDVDVDVDVDVTSDGPTTDNSLNVSHSGPVGAKRRRASDALSLDGDATTTTKKARPDAATATSASTNTQDSQDTNHPTTSTSSTCTKPKPHPSAIASALLAEFQATAEYAPSSSSWGSTSRPAAPVVHPATTVMSAASAVSAALAGDVGGDEDSTVSNASGVEYEYEYESSCDIFLSAGFREQWCRCAHCLQSLAPFEFLTHPETTYEPPADPERGASLEALGMRALASMPRERALDGVRAFNDMRDGLMAYLRPFASEGKVVSKDDVTRFFEERREAAEAARKGAGD